jgi:pimeloyl-ACP methyl ester carboxylesterase/DNA-binding CsgD family transcriptional regulator
MAGKSAEPAAQMNPARQEIRFCAAPDGVRLAYATSGSGPPLLRIGSFINHLDFDWGSPVWRHWLVEFSRHHTLVRYDARGCGLSDRDVAEVSFDAWVADLETVVQAMGLERLAILAMSQGVPVAIAYAVRNPDRVSHLVLYGGYSRGRLHWGGAAANEAQAMVQLAELGWGKDNAAFRQFFTTQFIPDGTPEQHGWFNELERVSVSPAIAARFMQVTNELDVTALAARVACPTLVLHADRDARVPFDEGRRLASLIPAARFVPLDSRNHVLLEHESAWRRLLDEVGAFLPSAQANTGSGAFARLTPRERELVELIAQGRDNAQIAARLALAEKTVRNHITTVFSKLEVENRAQAIVRARQAGFGRAT